MANPFSGLENIGQSYLQGVQLANQRQAREEAAAQRAQDSRMRGQYYQDLVEQRREAAALAATGRADELARRTAADKIASEDRKIRNLQFFGENLVYKDDGETVDLIASAKGMKQGKELDALAFAAGEADAYGEKVEIPDSLRKRSAFNEGRAKGLVNTAQTRLKMPGIMASQGFAPLPDELESAIIGTKAVDFSPEMLSARTATGQPVVSPEVYQDLDIRKVYGQAYGKKTKPVKAEKVDRPITVTIRDEDGKPLQTIEMSKEEFADYQAKQLSMPSGAPAATNAAPSLPRFFFDKKSGGYNR